MNISDFNEVKNLIEKLNQYDMEKKELLNITADGFIVQLHDVKREPPEEGTPEKITNTVKFVMWDEMINPPIDLESVHAWMISCYDRAMQDCVARLDILGVSSQTTTIPPYVTASSDPSADVGGPSSAAVSPRRGGRRGRKT
jgi:hypothetical protein